MGDRNAETLAPVVGTRGVARYQGICKGWHFLDAGVPASDIIRDLR